jgi:hypothetical protein
MTSASDQRRVSGSFLPIGETLARPRRLKAIDPDAAGSFNRQHGQQIRERKRR